MVIVDSRTFEEYHRGCIPGSISVPGGELVLRIGELVERPETTIVVHCGGRTRSYIGAESLRRMRLPNPIVALENGTMGWELAGLTLERGATRGMRVGGGGVPGSRSSCATRSSTTSAWATSTHAGMYPARAGSAAAGWRRSYRAGRPTACDRAFTPAATALPPQSPRP